MSNKNYYGALCVEMYEILHKTAPTDELDFYLSYAAEGQKILEPLCGSGRFLIPFLQRGYDIVGMDSSKEMLAELTRKMPAARAVCSAVEDFHWAERFDYIFISSGSVSLFTDMKVCKNILRKIRDLLNTGGKFVFAVDTVAVRCEDDEEYRKSVSVKTADGSDLILKTKNHYDESTQTQFSPGYYELYTGSKLLKREFMDFQTHLYRFGEMEEILSQIGFTQITVYSSFDKTIAEDDRAEMFLFECTL